MTLTPSLMQQDNSEPSTSLIPVDFLNSSLIENIISLSIQNQDQTEGLPLENLQHHILINTVKLKYDQESLAILPQEFSGSQFNQVLIRFARGVSAQFRQACSFQTDSVNSKAEMIMIRRDEPEYTEIMGIKPLTNRELEVLKLIVDGYSNIAIAEQLYITIGTVKTHVRNVLGKLYVSDRTQAAIRALRSGLVY